MDKTVHQTSANLVKLLRENGPTPIDSINASYQARFRRGLNLQGRGIHGSMAAGLLPGIVYRKLKSVTYLAAKTAERTKAAGGGQANSTQPVASASSRKRKHVEVSKQPSGVTATAASALQPAITTSTAKDLAAPGLLVITDIASYTAAVEMFVLRPENTSVKTLGQACAERTVGLCVVQDDLDGRTTGTLTRIQASIQSRQVGDASIAV